MLTDSARKRNRKEVLAKYNKIRINIGYQHDRCGIEESEYCWIVSC
jgi:CRISPR/Cas system CSM-associated protein Csm2 small subunit